MAKTYSWPNGKHLLTLPMADSSAVAISVFSFDLKRKIMAGWSFKERRHVTAMKL